MECDDDGNPVDSRISQATKRGSVLPPGAASYYGIRGGSGMKLPDEMVAGSSDEDGGGGKRRKRAGALEFGGLSSDDSGGGGSDNERRKSKTTFKSITSTTQKKKRARREVPRQEENEEEEEEGRPREKGHVAFSMNDRLKEMTRRGRELMGVPDEEENSEAEEDNRIMEDEDGYGSEIPEGAPKFRMCRAPDVEEMLEELQHTASSSSKCFGCTHGRPSNSSVAFEGYRTMERMFNEKLSTTEAVSLAKLLAQYYEELRTKANKHRQDDETPMPVWDAATIYEHFMYHMNDFTLRIASRLKMLNTLIKYQYENGCWLSTGRGRRKRVIPSERGIKIFKDLVTLEAKLYSQKPRGAMFSSAAIGTNSDEVRSLIEKGKMKFHTSNASGMKRSSVVSQSSGGRGGTVHGGGSKK